MTLKEYMTELDGVHQSAYDRMDMAVHKYSVINGVDYNKAIKALHKMDADDAMAYADVKLDNVVSFSDYEVTK